MVAEPALLHRAQRFLCWVPLVLVFFLEACTVDLLGLFVSNDLDSRFGDRNTFNFLSGADRTLALPETYSFIVVTDTHIENGDAHGLERLKDVITPEDKFVVITGDITQSGTRTEVLKFIEIAATLGVPCYPVLGNHDIYFNNWPVWKELIGSTCYRIDSSTGGATLFILDSANAFFGAAQLDWLEKELRTANPQVFVFSHTNLFVENPVNIEQLTDVRERSRFRSLLKDHRGAMFMGHVHQRIITATDNIEYITIEAYVDTGIYCRMYVSPDGLRYEFKKL